MSGFHSVRPRARNAIRKTPRPAPENPYSPTSAGFTERNRETVREHPSGLVQVDKGEPSPPYPGQPQR